MPRQTTSFFKIPFGWNAGEDPGTADLDMFRFIVEAAMPKGFAVSIPDSLGLALAVQGGVLPDVNGVYQAISTTTLTLPASSVCYVERTTTGGVSYNLAGWTAGKVPIALVQTGATTISTVTDKRPVTAVGTAAQSYFQPSGNISAATVQAAIQQLDARVDAQVATLNATITSAQAATQAYVNTYVTNVIHVGDTIDGNTTHFRVQRVTLTANLPATVGPGELLMDWQTYILYCGDQAGNRQPIKIPSASVIGLPDLSSVKPADTGATVTYDSQGRVSIYDQTVSGVSNSTNVTYLSDGRVNAVVYKTGGTVTRTETMTYDASNNLTGYTVS